GYVVVAGDGTILERTGLRPSGLVALGQAKGAAGEPGIREALEVLDTMPAELRSAVRRATPDGPEVSVVLRGGGTVRYGEPRDLPAKHAVLRSLLGWVSERGVDVDYIDVRAPHSPVLKPVAPPATNSGGPAVQ
ncbi:MAG: cell division protein FtsQ/DivIB, partial [Actinomycetota bacterium]|nr:cell division protein FtsQ/DivIB [Actinomycetota bacterium]